MVPTDGARRRAMGDVREMIDDGGEPSGDAWGSPISPILPNAANAANAANVQAKSASPTPTVTD